MTTLVVHAVALVLAAALFTWIERHWPAHPSLRWWQRPVGIDLTYWFVGPLLGQVALFTGLVVIGLGLLALLGAAFDRTLVERLQQGHPLVAAWPVWIQVVTAFVVADLTLYWIHRAFHRLPFLWPLHAVHHSATRLDWLAAVRVHPLNSLIGTTVLGVVLIACGFPLAVLAGVVPLLGLLALLGHANVSWEFGPVLRYVFASPRFHRWHHTQVEEGGDRNFAAFIPLWDRLFGTWYLPGGRVPERFGIVGDPVPHHFIGQLAYPFVAWATSLRRWCGLAPGTRWGWRRHLATWTALVVAAVFVLGALLGPLSTLAMQVSLPRNHGDLHLIGYRRGGPAPTMAEGIRFTLPRDTAHGWFMAAVGHGLPPPVADPGSVVWGEVRSPDVGAPLPVQTVSAVTGSPPRLDITLDESRVNIWLLIAARRDRSPWVVKVAAGSRLSDTGMTPPPTWDQRLRLVLSGSAARRDGQPGLVLIETLEGSIDLRWSPGANDTRVEARVQIDRLRVSDPRRGETSEVPAFLLGIVAEAISKGLRERPPLLPFVVPRDVRLSLEVVSPSAGARPAF